MTKETLTDEAIRYDVLGNEVKKAKTNDYKSLVWVAPIMVAALAVGYFVHVLLGLLIGLGAIVPIYFYFKQNKADAGVIFQVEHDCEFVVEIDTLSHIDQVYASTRKPNFISISLGVRPSALNIFS